MRRIDCDGTDPDLVLEAARRRPQYTFVLLGLNADQDLAKLAALENVRVLGRSRTRKCRDFLCGNLTFA